MVSLYYDTLRLKCRPLTLSDSPAFANEVVCDAEIQRYFNFGRTTMQVVDFLESLNSAECIPVGIFSKATNLLVGYINGYVFAPGELLVEFFVLESFRRNNYMYEALGEYMYYCKAKDFTTFRFEVEPENVGSIALLDMLGADHSDSQDFTVDIPKKGETHFHVYHIYR